MQKIKIVLFLAFVVFCVVMFFKIKNWLTNRAYKKGVENRKRRFKK